MDMVPSTRGTHCVEQVLLEAPLVVDDDTRNIKLVCGRIYLSVCAKSGITSPLLLLLLLLFGGGGGGKGD